MALPAELRRQRTLQVDARTFARKYLGVLPNEAQGPVLLVVLSDEPHVTGVLVISGLGKRELSPRLRGVVQAMIEPLASALRHHVRQRDAMTLREAAEADVDRCLASSDEARSPTWSWAPTPACGT